MSFPDTEDASASAAAEAAITSPHLLNALRMLEESTWALDPHPSAPAASIQALGYDLPWHLVALFCRVHSLPRSLTLLHELARNNDWVMFLYESDLQQCPADTVPRNSLSFPDFFKVNLQHRRPSSDHEATATSSPEFFERHEKPPILMIKSGDAKLRCWTLWQDTLQSFRCKAICRSWRIPLHRKFREKVAMAEVPNVKGKDVLELRASVIFEGCGKLPIRETKSFQRSTDDHFTWTCHKKHQTAR